MRLSAATRNRPTFRLRTVSRALSGEQDGFVVRLDVSGTTLRYSTYFGGSQGDQVNAVAVPETGDQYVAGGTSSADFPVASPLFNCRGNTPCGGGFLTRISDAAAGTIHSGDVVLYAAEVTHIYGKRTKPSDSGAAGGVRLTNPDAGAAKIATPLASPTHYFDVTTDVAPNSFYHLWIRGKAANNSWANDSVYVQFTSSFSDALATQPGSQIGTTSAMTVQIEDCTGCGLHGWGWADNGYGYKVLGAYVFIASSSTTIGVQMVRMSSSLPAVRRVRASVV